MKKICSLPVGLDGFTNDPEEIEKADEPDEKQIISGKEKQDCKQDCRAGYRRIQYTGSQRKRCQRNV